MKEAKKLLLWGAGGHAMVAAEIASLTESFSLVGFIDDTKASGDSLLGVPVYQTLFVAKEAQPDCCHLLVAIGDCNNRMLLANKAIQSGYHLATLIHPRAVVSKTADLGCGTLIAAGAVVGTNARVGQNVIINTCASVDHDCVVSDGVHISPGVRLAGRVRVGRGTWIGIGAAVIDGMEVGEGAIVGAGAVVVSSIPDSVVVVGVPARIKRRLDA